MSYFVECNDQGIKYGMFDTEDEARTYAALCDVDPRCESGHKVYYEYIKEPIPYEELIGVIRKLLVEQEVKHE